MLSALAHAIDTRDWVALAALLSPAFTARYPHTGETFDAGQFVALNRDYPGVWRFQELAVVDAGRQGVLRARVSDATGETDEAHHVASFAVVDDEGRLAELVEIWAEESSPPDGDRRPPSAVGGPS